MSIVGVNDFLEALDHAMKDPAWSGPTIFPTGYAFAAPVLLHLLLRDVALFGGDGAAAGGGTTAVGDAAKSGINSRAACCAAVDARVVMAGLVPAIHAVVQASSSFLSGSRRTVQVLQSELQLYRVDGRDKPGHGRSAATCFGE